MFRLIVVKLDAFGVKCQSNTTTDNLVGVLLVPYFRQVCHYAYSAFVLFDFSVFLQLNTNPKKKNFGSHNVGSL